MKIEFELTAKQVEVLKEVMSAPQNAGQTENEVCRIIMVQSLISIKQQLIAQELSK